MIRTFIFAAQILEHANVVVVDVLVGCGMHWK